METAALPDDLDVCHGMIRELSASYLEAGRRMDELEHGLVLLLRRLRRALRGQPAAGRLRPGRILRGHGSAA